MLYFLLKSWQTRSSEAKKRRRASLGLFRELRKITLRL
jgi:hypothetical protein